MARGDYPSSELDKYIVRFPDGLRDRLKGIAAANNRSMNAEIVQRLEASFAPTATLTPEIAALIERYVQQQVENRLHAVAAKLAGGVS